MNQTFSFDKILCSQLVLIFGSPGSQRQQIVLEFLTKKKNKSTFVFNGGMDYDNNYKNLAGESNVFSKLSDEILQNIFETQKEFTFQYKDRNRGHQRFSQCDVEFTQPDCFLVIEGFSQREMIKSNMLTSILEKGRHLFITTVVVLRAFLETPYHARLNVDWILISKSCRKVTIESLYEYYVGRQLQYSESFAEFVSADTSINRILCGHVDSRTLGCTFSFYELPNTFRSVSFCETGHDKTKERNEIHEYIG